MAVRRLIIAPHHDDAEFGLGGHMQHWWAQGDTMRVIVACHGSYRNTRGVMVSGEDRRLETLEAVKLLGFPEVEFGDWMLENQANETPYGKLVGCVERAIAAHQPKEVYVALPSFNQDHRALYAAVKTAFRPGKQTASLYGYEYPGCVDEYEPPAFGRVYRELTNACVRLKTKALLRHKSQFAVDARDVRAVTTLAERRGYEAGFRYAEAIWVIRETHAR